MSCLPNNVEGVEADHVVGRC